MALEKSINDREYDKFVAIGSAEAVRVTQAGGFAADPATDAIGVTYPDAVTSVYSYYTGGLAGTLIMTVTLIFTDATKSNLVSAVKT